MPMKPRKLGQPTFPTLYYKDGVLSIPGYTFEKVPLPRFLLALRCNLLPQAVPWHDTGSLTLLAEGNSLKDGSNILAKIAPAQSNGSMCLEREAHMCVPIPYRMLFR